MDENKDTEGQQPDEPETIDIEEIIETEIIDDGDDIDEGVHVDIGGPGDAQQAAGEQASPDDFGAQTAGTDGAAAGQPGEQAAQPSAAQAEPPTKAVGISYDEGDTAPHISSIGEGEMAQAIVDMANELGIYIHKDANLMAQLENLKEGEEVPKELYVIIATILSFSYLLQGKTPEIFTRKDGTKSVNIEA